MKRQATLLTIAIIVLLTTCGAYRKDIVVTLPSAPSTKGVADKQVEFQEPTNGILSIEDVISWFAYELLSTVTNTDDHDATTHAWSADREQGPAPAADTDPHRLRARGQFQAPTLSRPRDPRQ